MTRPARAGVGASRRDARVAGWEGRAGGRSRRARPRASRARAAIRKGDAADRGDRCAPGPGAEVLAPRRAGRAPRRASRASGRPSGGDPLRSQRPVPGDQCRGGSRLARAGDPSDTRAGAVPVRGIGDQAGVRRGVRELRLHRQEGSQAGARQARHLRGCAAHRLRQPRHLPALGVLYRPAEHSVPHRWPVRDAERRADGRDHSRGSRLPLGRAQLRDRPRRGPRAGARLVFWRLGRAGAISCVVGVSLVGYWMAAGRLGRSRPNSL